MQDQIKIFEDLMLDYLSGKISDHDECVLLNLLNSDPIFKRKYGEMVKSRAISLIPAIKKVKAKNYKLVNPTTNNIKSSIRLDLNFIQYFSRVAAILFFVLSTSITSYYIYKDNFKPTKLVSCEIVVPLGSQTKIILPDGTVAWLNSGSTLTYNNLYGVKNREVSLTGEGFFDVAKDKSRPFLVHTNNIEVKVLGTVFNIRSYSDDPTVEVNLLEGKVDVSMLNTMDNNKLTLHPNQKAVYDKKKKSMLSINSNASKSAQWTTGKLCFVNASIEEIAKDLQRKYDVHIKIESEMIKKEIFSGSLNLNQPLIRLLNYIDVDKKFEVHNHGKEIIIKNKY